MLACVSLSQVRFKYEKTYLAGFVEMTQEWSQGQNKDVTRKFRRALLSVPGVTKVVFHPKGDNKQQRNFGNHYQEHNLAFSSQKKGTEAWMEFELTRDNHIDGDSIFTVTACFRLPVREHIMEAWRVLIKACRSNALLPTVVDENYLPEGHPGAGH